MLKQVVLMVFALCLGYRPIAGVIWAYDSPGKSPTRQYYANGQLRYEGYISGEMETDYWRFYYVNGRLRAHGEYKRGLKESWWEEYYENGKLKREGCYRDGRKTHYWTFYEPSGALIERVYFENGRQVKDKSVSCETYR